MNSCYKLEKNKKWLIVPTIYVIYIINRIIKKTKNVYKLEN